MDQPRVAVVREDDRLVAGEERVVLEVRHPVRVVVRRQQPRHLDDVHHPHRQIGQLAAQQIGGGQRLLGGDVAGAGQHHVRVAAAVLRARPVPGPGAAGAVGAGLVEGEPVEARLLAGDDHIDVVAAAQYVIGHREQGVGVRREIDPDDLGALVEDLVDEAGVLVREAVVVLPPDVRGQQVVEGGDGAPPGQPARGPQPLDVLVDHRVDDMGERLVAGEEAVPPGEQIALQPALAQVLGQHLHHPAVPRQMLVGLPCRRLPRLAGGAVDRVQPVGGGLVRADEPEVAAPGGRRHDIGEQPAEHPGRLVQRGPGFGDVHRVPLQRRQRQRAQQQPAVGVRRGAQPVPSLGHARQHLRTRPARLVEQLLRPVRAQPPLQLVPVVGVIPYAAERHLMGAPGALHRLPVDLVRARPALGRPQHDHRPAGTVGRPLLARPALDRRDPVQRAVHGGGHRLVHRGRVVAGDMDRIVAVAAQQGVQFVLRDAGEHRGIGDLVAVEMQDRQHGAVVHRVEELRGVPGRGERPGLRLPVADHAGDQQPRVVERRTVGMREGVAQLAALMDGARRLRRDMAGHPARERELPEQQLHPRPVPAHVRIGLRVRAVQPGVGQDGRPAVPRPPHAQRVQTPGRDHPLEMRVHQVQPRCGAPVPQQPRLDVLGAQRLLQQRVGHQVDLPGGEVVGGPPVRVQRGELRRAEMVRARRRRGARRSRVVPWHLLALLGPVRRVVAGSAASGTSDRPCPAALARAGSRCSAIPFPARPSGGRPGRPRDSAPPR